MKTTALLLLFTLSVARAEVSESPGDAKQSNTQELRKMKLGSTLQQGNPDARSAQLKLAKMGETPELQEIYCQLYSKYREDILDAGEIKLPQVGGWFAIKSLDQLFDADSRFSKAKVRTNDLSFPAAHQFGLVLLPKLVPNPPFPFNDGVILESAEQQREKVKIWRQWIAEHENELSKLEPTGAGVEFSANACKDGKPRQKKK
jgi:hypothetical protein